MRRAEQAVVVDVSGGNRCGSSRAGQRYGASTAHIVASDGAGLGPAVEGFGPWSCTLPPPCRPAFSSRVETTYPVESRMPNWSAVPGSPLSMSRMRKDTGCGSAGFYVVAVPEASRKFEPRVGVGYPAMSGLTMGCPD